jgi:signal transduction histidine kinase
VIEADRERLAANMAALVEAGVRRNTEYTTLRPDGTTVPTEASTAVIRDAAGQVKAVMAVIRDITELKQAEAAREQQRRALKHMLKASDHERQVIAYDIHDGLAQQLAGAIMQFQICAHAQRSKPEDAAKTFDAGMRLLQQSHFEARRLISGVRPPILDESGVLAAIAHLVHDPAFDQGPKIEFRSRVTFNRLDPMPENAIYRIVQEGLTNSRKHSKSKTVLVSLLQRGERLRIEIRDWGIGFDAKKAQENRFGLRGIRERARLLAGTCRIRSRADRGTSIVVELPLAEGERQA